LRGKLPATSAFCLGSIAPHIAELLRTFDELTLAVGALFGAHSLVTQAVNLLTRHFRGFPSAGADRSGGGASFHVQSSSASRVTAGALGFLTLSQCGERPER
jgi:hypothetical protein